jgi:hypothetical protein
MFCSGIVSGLQQQYIRVIPFSWFNVYKFSLEKYIERGLIQELSLMPLTKMCRHVFICKNSQQIFYFHFVSFKFTSYECYLRYVGPYVL